MSSADARLGATEFAATLNGDNPEAILSVLKRFTKTVRKERRIALSNPNKNMEEYDSGDNDDGDSSDSSSSESEEEDDNETTKPLDRQPPKKKLRKGEEWKEDTKSYDVPFVGTAIATGDVGTVVVGEWPTGLLKAYLERSPLAIELTGDDLIPPEGQVHKTLIRKKKGKLSRAIYRAYLRALRELLTSGMSTVVLRREFSDDDDIGRIDHEEGGDQETNQQEPRFLGPFLKNRLKHVFEVLKDETEKGHGKVGTPGGCGPLAVPAIEVLEAIALTSTANARLICRHLDESLNEGVIRVILKPPNKRVSSPENPNPKDIIKKSRAAGINLARVLFETNDHTVLAHICTSGSKERKIKAGILYLALRDGLSNTNQNPPLESVADEYLYSVADLIKSVRRRVVGGHKIVNQKVVAELLSKEALQNLCTMTLFAPALSADVTFEDVLSAEDEYAEVSALEEAATEARRLTFPLLGKPELPILSNTLKYKVSTNASGTDIQQIIRYFLQVLDSGKSVLEIRRFVLRACCEVPPLLSGILRNMTFPDPNNTLLFISQLRSASFLLKNAQKVILPSDFHGQRDVDHLLHDNILYPSRLKKPTLHRVLQASNSLLIFEGLKFVLSAIQTFYFLIQTKSRSSEFSSDPVFIDTLSRSFFENLPDLQALVKVRQRFESLHNSQQAVILCDCLYRIFNFYVEVFPFTYAENKFDWTKLLPETVEQFFKMPLSIQKNALDCISGIIQVNKRSSTFGTSSFQSISNLMVMAPTSRSHSMIRGIVIKLVLSAIGNYAECDIESRYSLEYEAGCWVDGLSAQNTSRFAALLKESTSQSLNSTLIAGRAWIEAGLPRPIPKIQVSPLLVTALNKVHQNHDKTLDNLSMQTALKCLVSSKNPLPFAALIHFIFEKKDSNQESLLLRKLVQYSGSLVHWDSKCSRQRYDLFKEAITSSLDERCKMAELVACITERKKFSFRLPSVFDEEVVELMRMSRHMMIALELSASDKKICVDSILSFLQILMSRDLKLPTSEMLIRDSKHIYDWIQVNGTTSQKCAIALTSSLSLMTIKHCSHNGREQDEGDPDPVAVLLKFMLLAPFLTSNLLVGSLLHALQCCTGAHEPLLDVLAQTLLLVEDETPPRATDFSENNILGLVQSWLALTDAPQIRSSNEKMRKTIASRIEALIVSLFEKGEPISKVQLLSCFTSFPPKFLLTRALESMSDAPEKKGVFQCLVMADPVRFGPDFLQILRGSDGKLNKLWRNGFFDSLLMSVPSDLISDAEFVHEVVSRVEDCIEDSIKRGSFDISSNLLHVLEFILKTPVDPSATDSVTRMMAKTMSSLDNGVLQRPSFPIEMKLWDLCDLLLSLKVISLTPVGVNALEKLAIPSLSVLSVDIQKLLKVGSSPAIILKLIRLWSKVLLNLSDGSLAGAMATNYADLRNLVRRCLKISIADSYRDEMDLDMRQESLVLISNLIMRSANFSDNNSFQDLAFDVFSMTVNHSKFIALFSNEYEGRLEKLIIETLNLLRVCLINSTKAINIEKDVWSLLFSRFGACTSNIDNALRLILETYNKKVSHTDTLRPLMLHEYRWGSSSDSSVETEGGFGWLVSELDLTTIRGTLSQFPINDTLYLLNEKTSSATSTKNCDSYVQSSDDNGGDREEDGDSSEESSESDERAQVETTNAMIPPYQELAKNNRYSPGFLLPVILGAMESGLAMKPTPTASSSSSYVDQDGFQSALNVPFSIKNDFALIAHGLCERGALALAIASLCSSCAGIRKVAVSIITLFLLALDTKEARDLSSWRERPQILMVLNCLRRGLLKKISMKRKTLDHHVDQPEIPRLPVAVAIFLARSSLIVMKPEDPLYVAINRLFLKSDIDGGAFQDMNRIPGFVGLFCSSNEDAFQARKERLWALHLLKDSTLDSYSYALAASCHAPELIISSLDNFRSRESAGDKEGIEASLILEALTAFLVNGGFKAFRHLVGRMGLLSWIRTIFTGRPIFQILPSVKSRMALVDLIGAAAKAACIHSSRRKDVLIQELIALPEVLVQTALHDDDIGRRRKSNPNYGEEVFSRVCQSLKSIQFALEALGLRDEGKWEKSNSAALSLISTSRFIRHLQGDDEVNAGEIFSNLPIRLASEESDAAALVCARFLELLECPHAKSEKQTTMKASILHRTLQVSNYFGRKFDEDGSVLLTLIMKSDCMVSSTDNRAQWIKCLESLLATLPEGQEDDDRHGRARQEVSIARRFIPAKEQ